MMTEEGERRGQRGERGGEHTSFSRYDSATRHIFAATFSVNSSDRSWSSLLESAGFSGVENSLIGLAMGDEFVRLSTYEAPEEAVSASQTMAA